MSLESPPQGPANPFWWNWYTWWTLLQFYYLRWPYADGLTYLLGSLTVNLTVLLIWFSFFLLTLVFYDAMAFLSLGNSDHVVTVSMDFPPEWKGDTPSHRIAYVWLFSRWLGQSLWSFERCSLGWYLEARCFCFFKWILWVSLGWNWRIYPSL